MRYVRYIMRVDFVSLRCISILLLFFQYPAISAETIDCERSVNQTWIIYKCDDITRKRRINTKDIDKDQSLPQMQTVQCTKGLDEKKVAHYECKEGHRSFLFSGEAEMFSLDPEFLPTQAYRFGTKLGKKASQGLKKLQRKTTDGIEYVVEWFATTREHESE